VITALEATRNIATQIMGNFSHSYLAAVATLSIAGTMRIIQVRRAQADDPNPSKSERKEQYPLPILLCKQGSYTSHDIPLHSMRLEAQRAPLINKRKLTRPTKRRT
jgi:hypothetical protein